MRVPASRTSQSQFGYIERVEENQIVGWAIDLTQGEAPASLYFFIDDERISQVETDVERPDVANVYPSHPMAGFSATIPGKYFDGASHQLVLRFVNSGAYVTVRQDDGTSLAMLETVLTLDLTILSYIDGLQAGVIKGWVLTPRGSNGRRNGNQSVSIRCEGLDIATIKAADYRPDVGRALDGDDYCGFRFNPPVRYRNGGRFQFEFTLAGTSIALANSPYSFEYPKDMPDSRLARLFLAVEDASIQLYRLKRELIEVMTTSSLTLDDYDAWARQYQVALRARRATVSWPEDTPRPLVSVLCPVYRPLLKDFRAAVSSVLGQTWRNLELILVDDASASPGLSAVLEEYAAADDRVRLIVLEQNQGIAGATNFAIAAARGEYTALFDHDDLLLDVALETMMDAARLSGAKMLYSDEDKIDTYGRFSDPNLKPAWNYRLLLGQNYVCHFLVLRTEVLRAAGPLNKKYDGAQDHALVLRLSEIVEPEAIVHVPEIIYHWRKTPGSTATAVSAKSYAVKAGANAVRDHLARRGLKAKVSPMLGVTVYAPHTIGCSRRSPPSRSSSRSRSRSR